MKKGLPKILTLFFLLALGITSVWADSGVITAAASTDLGSGKTPRYVVDQSGVGRLMKNKTGSSSWSLSSGALTTGSSLFALQTYNAITEIVIYGSGTGNNRTLSKVEVGTATNNYAEVTPKPSVTESGTDDGKFTTSGTADSMHIVLDVAKDSYVAITLSGNINITSVKFIYAPTGYSITYNCDGAETGCPTTNPATGQTALPNPLPVLTKTGFTFDGWYTDSEKNTKATPGASISSNTTLYANWIDNSTPTHAISYNSASLKGADVSSYPTEFYQGTGIASFDALADVTGFHFNGWNPASIGSDVTTDVEVFATWVAAYNVTFSAGEGNGTVPATFQKWEGATFELPGQGSMVAPSGKVFDGWKVSTTKYAAGAEYTMGNTAVEFVAQWKAAPKVLFYYQWTGASSAPTANSALTATGGTFTFYKSESSTKEFTVANVGYNAGVPADMKTVAGTSDKLVTLNSTTNNSYLATLTGDEYFKVGDTVYFAGYGNFKVGSTHGTDDIVAATSALETGTGASDVNVGYFIFPSVENVNTLYFTRHENSNNRGFTAIKVIRPVQYTVNFAAGDGGSGTMEAKKYPAGATVTLPACTFTAPSLKEFDAWTSADVTISSNQFTMPANDVTVTATWKNETPKYTVTYSKGAYGTGTIAADTKVKDIALTLSSERFTRDGYLQTGWAETDGGAQAYALGATYTANAPIELFPVWTAVNTYTASFACADAAPAGWTFSTGAYATDDQTVDYVCKFVENGEETPRQTTGDGTTLDDVAFAKNTSAIATYDLGITTTVVALDVTLCGGSSSAFDETIEYLGEDGTTVKKTYTNSLGAGNWKDNVISKTDLIEDVRYIRVHGASKWVVMKDFSVKYIETRTKYNVNFAAGDGTGTMEALKCIEGATVTVPASTFTAPTNQEFEKWAINGVVGITEINPAETFTMPANSVTLTAQWQTITDKYTVVYKDGTTDLGSETVEVGKHPKAIGITTDKPFYTFESWQLSGSDVALSDVSGTKDEVINLVARYTAKYAQSINIEQWVLDNRVNNTEFRAVFDAKGYEYDNLNDLDSLNDGKDYRNYPFLGQKIKAANASISFLLKAGSKARIRFGNVGASFTLKVGSDETTLDNSYANTTVASKISHEVNAASDVVVQIINVENNKTLVIKQIMIDEPIADVVLPWRVTYDANGGTCTTPEAIWKGSAITLPAATPANPADVFDGWYDDPSAGTKIGAAGETYDATANVTLYAHYVAAPPTPDYTRTGLSAGKIGTLFVGYATSGYTGATFYELAGKSADGQQITFEEVTGQLEADKPYIFEASADHIDLYYADPSATQVAEADHNGLYGVTSEQHIAASAEIYYFSNNQLYKADAFSGGATDLTVAANRCYIKIAEVPGSVSPKPGRKYISLHMNGGQVATGIEDVQSDNVQSTKVLINGTLFILRGEKMYDTTGRLVK